MNHLFYKALSGNSYHIFILDGHSLEVETVVMGHVNENVTVTKLHDQSYFRTLNLDSPV